jgi:hypothetical protein
VELSSKKGTEAPNIEFEVEDCEEYTTTFSFYVISDSNLSYSAHDDRDFWSHFKTPQLKEDATASVTVISPFAYKYCSQHQYYRGGRNEREGKFF